MLLYMRKNKVWFLIIDGTDVLFIKFSVGNSIAIRYRGVSCSEWNPKPSSLVHRLKNLLKFAGQCLSSFNLCAI
jgi:hypothetical protein